VRGLGAAGNHVAHPDGCILETTVFFRVPRQNNAGQMREAEAARSGSQGVPASGLGWLSEE
jgi:hypothetical protein